MSIDTMDSIGSKKKDIVVYLFLIICIIQFLFLFYINLFHVADLNDYDASCQLVHSLEIWRQCTLFPLEYGYQTTLDLDQFVGITALIFGVTRDIFLSEGISNIILLILHIAVFYSILDRQGCSLNSKILPAVLFMIPYEIGQLGYFNMVLSSANYYSVRTLIPLLFIDCMLGFDSKKGFRWYAESILLAVFCFFSGLSSGYYILMCAILPVVAYEITDAVFIKQDIRSLVCKRSFLAVFFVLITCSGIVSARIMGFTNRSEGMVLASSSNWISNITACFVGMYQLFGGIASVEDVPLFSKTAVRVLSNWVITTVLIVIVIHSIIKILQKDHSRFQGYVISILAVNMLVLTLLFTTYGGGSFEYRYHLIPFMGIICMSGLYFEKVNGISYAVARYAISFSIIMVICISILAGDYLILKGVLSDTMSDTLENLDRELEDIGINTAVIYDSSGQKHIEGRMLRAYGDKINYVVVEKRGNADRWGASMRGFDNSAQSGKTALIVPDGYYNDLPEYIRFGLQYRGKSFFGDIYTTDDSHCDFISGLIRGRNRIIDFPYSPGYNLRDAEITDDGKLINTGKEGVVISSPAFDGVNGKYDISLNYRLLESTEERPELRIISGDTILEKAEMEKDTGSVKISGAAIKDEMKEIQFEVYSPKGAVFEIESITASLSD